MKRKERSGPIDTFIQKKINSISTVSSTPIDDLQHRFLNSNNLILQSLMKLVSKIYLLFMKFIYFVFI